MLPVLILAGVVGGGLYLHKHGKRKRTTTPALKGKLTPARVELHGCLMGQEFNPSKLERAAELFDDNGLPQQARDLKGKAQQIRKQSQVAAELVEAARSADQNAMGMIAAIREQAAQNNPRALVSANLIAQYCMKNPPKNLGPLGETPMLPPEA